MVAQLHRLSPGTAAMTKLAGLLLSLLLALPASAQSQRYVENCRQLCNAPARELSANPPAVQACMIRCQAGNDFNNPRSRGMNSGTGRPVAGASQGASGSWAVIYAATPPNAATGVSQGQADRNQAHLEANRACAAQAGVNCRVLGEAGPGKCIAAVQAGRTVGLVRTSDPRTFQVTLVDYGQGDTQAAADSAALRSCSGRGQCEVVARACGSR
jgi:hypothetical protein